MMERERIESIEINISTQGEIPRLYMVGSIVVNEEEICRSTAPSWHGVMDDLMEALHTAAFGDESNEPWLR